MPFAGRTLRNGSTTVTSVTAATSKLRIFSRSGKQHHHLSNNSNQYSQLAEDGVEHENARKYSNNNRDGQPSKTQALKEHDQPDDLDSNDWSVVKPREKKAAHLAPTSPAAAVYRPKRASFMDSDNWRDGTPASVNASGYTAPRTAGGNGTRITNRRANYAGANIFFGVQIAELMEGSFIWHMDSRECYNEQVTSKDGDLFKSADGQLHIRKPRFWYVTKVYEFHFNELPVYTYQHKGITEKKSEHLKKEHIGIRPPHIPLEKYVQRNEYPPLEIDKLKDKNEKLAEMAVLHFTEQRSSPMDIKLRVVGKFNGSSVRRVKELRAQFGH